MSLSSSVFIKCGAIRFYALAQLILFSHEVIIMLLRILQMKMKCYYVVLGCVYICVCVCVWGWLRFAQYIDKIIDNVS